jgi:hypothetical protein
LCQNGGLSILSLVGEAEKSKVGGRDVFYQKSPGEKKKM